MRRLALWLRWVAFALFVLVSAGGALTARVVFDGAAEMSASDAAFDRGDVRAATGHARRAAVLYAPGAPHVRPAYERMVAVAVGAEAAGDLDQARSAWRAVRGAALETAHVWVPQGAMLDRANHNLARLETLASVTPHPDPARAAAEALALLQHRDTPSAFWVAMLALGFVLSAVGVGWAGWRGVTPQGRLVWAQARWGLICGVVGAACWTLAAYRA